MPDARLAPLLLTALCAVSCGPNIHSLYDEAKLEALAEPAPAGTAWEPDGELGLGWNLVTSLAARELQQRLEDPDASLDLKLPLGAEASVSPDLELANTEMGPAKACEACVRLKSGFTGELDWTLGSLTGSVPLDLDVSAVLEMVTVQRDDSTVIEARLLRSSVKLPDDLEVKRLRIDLGGPLATWLQERVEAEFPPIPVAELGTADLPLRAVSLATSDDYLLVRVLTSSPTRSTGALVPQAQGDWYLSLDEGALLGLARKDAFEAEPMEYDVHADPRSLEIQDQAFVLGLRLWRLAGAGWWRDYQVSGNIHIDGDRLVLEPEAVRELDQSKGAGLVDPLALFAEGLILEAIQDALHIARPAQIEEPIGGAKLVLGVEGASGSGGTLSLRGTASIEEQRSKKNKNRQQKKGRTGAGGKGDGGSTTRGARSSR